MIVEAITQILEHASRTESFGTHLRYALSHNLHETFIKEK